MVSQKNQALIALFHCRYHRFTWKLYIGGTWNLASPKSAEWELSFKKKNKLIIRPLDFFMVKA